MSAMKNKEYIDINKIAELKGLKSNRSLRLAIQKGKYVARVVKVFGGKSYEILYSSLEPEIQEKLQDELIKEVTQSNCTALVPINNINNKNFITESAKLTALARVDIVKALQNMRTKYKTKKEADSIFLDLYNSGMYLPKIHKFRTQNVKQFVSLMDELQKVPPNIPKMALVYGEHGLGKSQTIQWWADKNDSVYVRATQGMTSRWLLSEIVEELGEEAYWHLHDNFEIIENILREHSKVIIVDEIDYLIDKNIIETLRDLHDKTACPVVLVGMGAADKKLARYPHLMDRMFNINAWIEDTKTKTYKVSENDWLKNKVVFETEVIEYKRYPIRVPADSTFEYNKTEKTTTGFSYTNAITKKSTLNFNQEMQASASYSKLSKELGNLQPMSTVSGYLKFAFSQGFEDTTFSELVKTENKEISETVKQTLTNGTEYEQKYEAIFNLIKVKAIVTLNDSVAAEFSLNSDIVFGGFELK